MRHKSPVTWIFNRRNHSLPWLESKGLGFHSPGFNDLAFSIDLQYFADAIGYEQIATTVECDSARHEPGPNLLQISIAIENLNARVIAIADVKPPIGTEGD